MFSSFSDVDRLAQWFRAIVSTARSRVRTPLSAVHHQFKLMLKLMVGGQAGRKWVLKPGPDN